MFRLPDFTAFFSLIEWAQRWDRRIRGIVRRFRPA